MTTKTESVAAYKKAIKRQYGIEKQGKYSSFLMTPSRAKLRQLCEERLKDSANKEDKISFNLVFGFEFETGNRHKLKAQTDKFRPIETFLKGETDLSDIEAINITALLVDFNPRPFRLFATKSISLDSIGEEVTVHSDQNLKNFGEFEKKKNNKNWKRKIGIGVLSLTGLFSIGYTVKDIVYPERQCMQWQNNHYEEVNCNSVNQQGIINQMDIIPFNEKQVGLIKIEVTDTSTFFKNGKAIIWYCKVDGKPQFFNTHGVHPETGKALKPVSKYIIKKYVK